MNNLFYKDKKFYLLLLVVLMFFGILVRFNFSVDTYLLFSSPNLRYISEYISNGRIITSLLFSIFHILRFTPNMMYVASYILGIISSTFAIYELSNILDKYIKNNILVLLLSILVIINPFIIELWLFIEMGVMMLSILTVILAFKYFDRYLESKNIKFIIYTVVFMFIAMCSYQGTVGLFMALSCISIFKKCNNIRSFFKNAFLSVACYLIPTIINFIFVLLFQNSRVSTNSNIVEKFNIIINLTGERLLNAFGLYPANFLKIFIVISIIISFLSIVLLQKNNKGIKFMQLLYLIGIVYFFTIAPIIPQNIDSIVMFPRTTYAFGSLIALILVFTNQYYSHIYLRVITIVISIIILAVEFKTFNNIAINRYIVNYKDKSIVMKIEKKIEKYETSTGNTITKISLYNLKNAQKFYPDINDMINVSALSEENSSRCMLSFYMKRRIDLGYQDNHIYDNYFKKKSWDSFSLEQIVLKDDTMHWYLY